MLMRKCFLAMLIMMLVILMLILMLLNLKTGYADFMYQNYVLVLYKVNVFALCLDNRSQKRLR